MTDKRSRIDLRTRVDHDERRAEGRALRADVPIDAHDHAAVSATRPTVLDFIAHSNANRLEHLIGLRVGRMIASPFTFFRGSAGLMAASRGVAAHHQVAAPHQQGGCRPPAG